MPLPAAPAQGLHGSGWGGLLGREPEKPPISSLLYHPHQSASPATPTTNPLSTVLHIFIISFLGTYLFNISKFLGQVLVSEGLCGWFMLSRSKDSCKHLSKERLGILTPKWRCSFLWEQDWVMSSCHSQISSREGGTHHPKQDQPCYRGYPTLHTDSTVQKENYKIFVR